jgi:hypothetical protein
MRIDAMKTCLLFVATGLAMHGAAFRAAAQQSEFPPVSLPAAVREFLIKLGSDCDILLLGETHGTQEVPAVVAAMLPDLTQSGFRVLALEIPHDQQASLIAWGKGEAGAVPPFFARPGPDGRGNEQVLALMRRALRPPFEWKLICFDDTEEKLVQQVTARLPKDAKGSLAERAAQLTPDDITALGIARDAEMAKHFAAERKLSAMNDKVLVICGNIHARTANNATEGSPITALWPSFAAVLKQDQPQWKLRSIHVQAFGGEYFNGGKMNKFAERPLDKIEVRATPGGDWDCQLNLPNATAATFIHRRN